MIGSDLLRLMSRKMTESSFLSTTLLIFGVSICMMTSIQLTALKRDIQDNYLADGPKAIAARHDTSIGNVHNHASRLGVTSNQRWDGEKDEIIRRYEAGDPIKTIARDLGHFHGSVKTHLVDWGITIRTPTESKVQYDFDTTFFAAIDSHEKAYWLGFIYADGNVYLSESGYKHVFQICLAAKDNGHLDKLKAALGDSRPLYNDRGNQRYMINSIPFVKALITLGVTPRKSLEMTFPTPEQVPLQYLNSFILGYFDGDGSLSVGAKAWGFNMISTWGFLEACKMNLIDHGGLHSTKLVPEKRKGDGKMAYLPYGGSYYGKARATTGCEHQRKDALLKLYRYLYADSPVWLDRKRTLFETALTHTYGHDWKRLA